MSNPSSEIAKALRRINHMLAAIAHIRRLLDGVTFDTFIGNPDQRAACERYIEIVSEASRHIPKEWQEMYGADIPWRSVSDLGNLLRHAYQIVDAAILWEIYENDLDPLQRALEAMIAAYKP
jgi:uncharacterized protein with HEPN domain